jgi:hypothetical protein
MSESQYMSTAQRQRRNPPDWPSDGATIPKSTRPRYPLIAWPGFEKANAAPLASSKGQYQ